MKALSAAGRSEWANSSFLTREHEHFYVRSFLFGCPIPATTSSGKHLPALDAVDSGMAAQVLDKLFGDLGPSSYYCNLELRQVARHLIDTKHDRDKVPRGNHEFLIFSKSPYGVLKDHYGLFPDKERQGLSANDVKPYEHLLILDAVYRHLRNGLAHGSFIEVRRKVPNHNTPAPYLYLQDINSHGQITARYYLSYKRVQLMAKLLQDK